MSSGPLHGAMNGQVPAIGQQQVQVQVAIEILLTVDGGIMSQVKPPNAMLSRPILNMMITTAHQDLLSALARQERAAKENGPAIEIAPPGSDVERNPKA